MCGIAGIINHQQSRQAIDVALRKMTRVMRYRGPDDEGYVCRDGHGIGMCRLSIIDVAGGQQPIANETGTIHVVCNGEIYNHAELRAELKKRGHVFRTNSDVEVINHLYEEKGDDFLLDLRGMFAIALWDQRKRKLLIARDRLGKKPLFYSWHQHRLLFASEIKSILAVDQHLSEPRPEATAQYFRYGFIPEPNTMFRRIHKLPAANYAVIQDDEFMIAPYWDIDFDESNEITETRDGCSAEELDELLYESVKLRLMSEVPLGVFLSGGLDSSAMVAYAHRSGLRPLRTFTIGFDRPAWDESADARVVANHFGTDHHELTLRESEMKRNLPDTVLTLVRHFDEPFGDPSSLPMYFVSKLAREHATVILSGDGGDELFAGYNTYRGIKFAEYYQRLPGWLGGRMLPDLAAAAAPWLPIRQRYSALRVAKVLKDSSVDLADSFFNKSILCRDNFLQDLLQPDVIDASQTALEMKYPAPIERIMSRNLPLFNKMAYADLRFFLLEDMLVKVDRMSMAHSLEVRSPMLDHHLVEFAARLPIEQKFRRWEGKAILKDVLRPMLPADVLKRKKRGFSVPLRDWLRTSLDEMVGDYLSPDGGRLPEEIFRPEATQVLLQQHRQGVADHSSKLWLLLNYAAWFDQYASQPTCGGVA